ncbi:MAG: hypothetical protein KA120_01860, partial [Candidatus Goldbacteria bacterium]|nr:hypothetical protein [Candidatus Goldiibacteriota bacterium]
FFNLVRPNTYKENKTPWDIVKEKNPDIPKKICMLPPIILDNMIHREYINSVYHLCPAPSHLNIFSGINCAPCDKIICNDRDIECMKSIKAMDVFEKIKPLI